MHSTYPKKNASKHYLIKTSPKFPVKAPSINSSVFANYIKIY